jgi:hypothetical protein
MKQSDWFNFQSAKLAFTRHACKTIATPTSSSLINEATGARVGGSTSKAPPKCYTTFTYVACQRYITHYLSLDLAAWKIIVSQNNCFPNLLFSHKQSHGGPHVMHKYTLPHPHVHERKPNCQHLYNTSVSSSLPPSATSSPICRKTPIRSTTAPPISFLSASAR